MKMKLVQAKQKQKNLENLGQEENYCLTADYYPGVDDEIFDLIKEIYKPDFVIKSEDVFYEKDELNKMMKPFLTEDRVRGVMYYGKMDDFIDDIKFAIKNDKDLAPEADKIIDDLFYNNAKKLYSKKLNLTSPKSNNIPKYLFGAVAGIALIALLCKLIQNHKAKK